MNPSTSLPLRMHHEKWGPDECGNQPYAVAKAVRHFFPLGLLALGA
jgi:hypothetical protein